MVLSMRCQLLGQLFLLTHTLESLSQVPVCLIGTFLIRCFGGDLWAGSSGCTTMSGFKAHVFPVGRFNVTLEAGTAIA